MISLQAIIERYGERILFLSDESAITYAQFAELLRDAPSLEGETIQLDLRWDAQAFARLFKSLLEGKCVFLGTDPPRAGLEPFLNDRPLLVLRTGGTTGAPRHVVHSASRLLSPYRLEDRPELRILILYAADHIAGLDAFLQAIHRGSTLVIPPALNGASVARTIRRQAVQVLPATPTFLNFLILSGELDEADGQSVEVIPYGAEPMSEGIRRRIGEVFPRARVVQRFGMSELGALPVRPDPDDPEAIFLDDPRYAWKLVEGELWISSPTRMLGTLEEGPCGDENWHPTGDQACLTASGAMRILGRREGIINVGGEKVLPEVVEGLLQELPEVRDASVFGIPNPLTGQAVAARVVFSGTPDAMAVLRAMRQLVRARGLSLAHVPTRIEGVDSIGRTAIGKKPRAKGKS